MALGFALYGEPTQTPHGFVSDSLKDFHTLLLLNYVLFFGLIIALTPQRQAVIDWARYRKQKSSSHKGLLNSSLLRDLAISKKSSTIVVIALNLAITAIILIPWIILAIDDRDRLSVLMTLVLSSSLILMCAAISQLVTLTQTKQQGLWIISALGTVIILPPVTLVLLSVDPLLTPTLWLLTVLAFVAIEKAGIFSIFLALLGQLTVLTLCSVQITPQLKKVGVSNSIGLFASQPRIKPTRD